MGNRNTERERIRAKLSDLDREFMDAMKATFPGCKLKAIHFNDGEKIGNLGMAEPPPNTRKADGREQTSNLSFRET